MTTSPPEYLITEHLDDDAVDRLAAHGIVHRLPEQQRGRPDDSALLARIDGLVVRTYTTVDDALLARCPRLRVIGRAGVGLDNIDRAACAARGVRVVHTPDANTHAVVEYVVGVVLDAIRPRPRIPASGLAHDAWQAARAAAVADLQIAGSTVGILGLGRIGRRVAAAFAGLGAEVIATDLAPIPADRRGGAALVPETELLARSQVLTVHVDGRPENRHLVDAARFAAMRPDVVFVNASRGFVVDAAALDAALAARPSMRAILDVHDPEPVPAGHPLLTRPNAILTPHVASRTRAASRAMSAVVDDVIAVVEGREPRWPAPASAPVSG